METRIAAHLKTVAALARRAGPYVLLEVLMPGGTILALLLYLHRAGHLRKLSPAVVGPVVGRAVEEALSAIAFALQPAGSLQTARREDGLELKMLAACR